MKTTKRTTLLISMKKLFFTILPFWIFPFLLQAQDPVQYETTARRLLDHLVTKDVDAMMEMFSGQFLEQVPREQISEIAHGLESQLGKYSHVSRVVHEPGDDYYTVILVTRFGEMDLGMRIIMDIAGKVTGFFITMAPPESYTPPPAYADSTAFTEIPTEVDCGDIRLPAMLTFPNTDEKVPIVVLVHGSGAHDMDESIGPNKIFRDIAWGLATHGIAVLRYEKRNFRNASTLDRANVTVWDEAGQDAVHAINMVMQLPGVDREQVYLLGHSLGGMIAPRIAKAVPELKGIVSLAGSPRQLWELIPGQIEHLISLRDEVDEASLKQLKQVTEMAKILESKRNDPNAVIGEELLGMPPSYLEDMLKNDVAAIAPGLKQRILILHGGRDYQVTMHDYNAWKEVLKDHHDTTFFLYPELNHLFFSGDGMPTPDEYFTERNVEKKVIEDIVKWIHAK